MSGQRDAWLVVICREGTTEATAFAEEIDARDFFARASLQWSDSYLTRTVRGPGSPNDRVLPALRPGDADVLTKRRQSTGVEVHYFIGPIRETLEEAEADRRRWEDGVERVHLREKVEAIQRDWRTRRGS